MSCYFKYFEASALSYKTVTSLMEVFYLDYEKSSPLNNRDFGQTVVLCSIGCMCNSILMCDSNKSINSRSVYIISREQGS